MHVLRGIDLDIMEGDFATLAGPSGSGKATLLNMIGALDHLTDGEVTVDGQSLSGMRKNDLSDLRLDKVGFIFQAYKLVLRLGKGPAAERQSRADKALAEGVGTNITRYFWAAAGFSRPSVGRGLAALGSGAADIVLIYKPARAPRCARSAWGEQR